MVVPLCHTYIMCAPIFGCHCNVFFVCPNCKSPLACFSYVGLPLLLMVQSLYLNSLWGVLLHATSKEFYFAPLGLVWVSYTTLHLCCCKVKKNLQIIKPRVLCISCLYAYRNVVAHSLLLLMQLHLMRLEG